MTNINRLTSASIQDLYLLRLKASWLRRKHKTVALICWAARVNVLSRAQEVGKIGFSKHLVASQSSKLKRSLESSCSLHVSLAPSLACDFRLWRTYGGRRASAPPYSHVGAGSGQLQQFDTFRLRLSVLGGCQTWGELSRPKTDNNSDTSEKYRRSSLSNLMNKWNARWFGKTLFYEHSSAILFWVSSEFSVLLKKGFLFIICRAPTSFSVMLTGSLLRLRLPYFCFWQRRLVTSLVTKPFLFL